MNLESVLSIFEQRCDVLVYLAKLKQKDDIVLSRNLIQSFFYDCHIPLNMTLNVFTFAELQQLQNWQS